MAGSVLVAVEGLPPWFRSEELKAICKTFGTVVSAKVIRDTATNRSLQLGLVEMETTEDAQRVRAELHGKQWGGHTLDVTVIRGQGTAAQ